MKWIKRFLIWGLMAVVFILVVLNVASTWMQVSDADIISEIPKAEVYNLNHDSLETRIIKIDNSRSNSLIIFIHGAPGLAFDFKMYLQDSLLQSAATLLAYDRPGYGTNSTPQPSIDFQAEILLNIINTYPNKEIILVGHSYGCAIAARASMLSRNIKSTILIAPLVDPESEPMFWFSYFSFWQCSNWTLPPAFRSAGKEKEMHAQELSKMTSEAWQLLDSPIIHIHGSDDGIAPYDPNVNFIKTYVQDSLLTQYLYPDKGHLIHWKNFEMVKEIILTQVNL